MANNFDVKDAAGTTITLRSTETSTVQAPHHVPCTPDGTAAIADGASLATLANQTTANTRAGTNGDAASKTGSQAAQLRAIADFLDGTTTGRLTVVSRKPVLVSATLTRPNDTTAYAINDAISDSTSSPSAITFANVVGANTDGGRIERIFCTTSSTSWTGAIRLYIYNGNSAPTATNDNAALTPSTTNLLGFADFSNFSQGICEGVLSSLSAMPFVTGTTTSLFGLSQNKSAPTPTALQTFTFTLTIDQV